MGNLIRAVAVYALLAKAASGAVAFSGYSVSNNSYMSASVVTSVPTAALSVTSGGFNVACLRWRRTGTQDVNTVTDTASNTYSSLGSAYIYNGDGLRCYAAANTTSNASNVVTFGLSGGADYLAAIQIHFTGAITSSVASAIDVYQATAQQATGATITSGSFSTSQADEAILAIAQVQATGSTWTADSPLTLIGNAGDGVVGAGYQIVAATQSSVTRAMTHGTAAASKHMILITIKAPVTATAARRRVIN